MTGKNGKIGKGQNDWTIIFLLLFSKERMNERKEEKKLVEK